jgi:hypothetical protein
VLVHAVMLRAINTRIEIKTSFFILNAMYRDAQICHV